MEIITDIEVWFRRLPADVRDRLRAAPDQELDAQAIEAIARVRGYGPTGAQWPGVKGSTPVFRLNSQEVDWISNLDHRRA